VTMLRSRRLLARGRRPLKLIVRHHPKLMRGIPQPHATRSWTTRAPALVSGALVGLLWILLLPRRLALLLFTVFLITALIQRLRGIPYLSVGVLAMSLLASWSPLDITFTAVAGGPKILRCCPGAPYRDLDAARLRQKRGECLMCGDLVPPNGNPKWYFAW
jgi:hypothetical protein